MEKTTYFVTTDAVFGRASFKGNEELTVKWRDEFFRSPKWREVSRLRYTLHPLFHKTLWQRYVLAQNITGWMGGWGYTRFWGNLTGWHQDENGAPYPKHDPTVGIYHALCNFVVYAPQEIVDRWYREIARTGL